MDTASYEVVNRATRLAGNGPALVKRRNKANDRFMPRPKGEHQMSRHGVATLGKGHAIPCELRLVPGHLERSVPIKP